jgi:capping protein beta
MLSYDLTFETLWVQQVGEEDEGSVHYCLTSTVMLALTTADQSSGSFSLSGSITRQVLFDTIEPLD